MQVIKNVEKFLAKEPSSPREFVKFAKWLADCDGARFTLGSCGFRRWRQALSHGACGFHWVAT
jgi:hypothetical protein